MAVMIACISAKDHEDDEDLGLMNRPRPCHGGECMANAGAVDNARRQHAFDAQHSFEGERHEEIDRSMHRKTGRGDGLDRVSGAGF